MKRKKITPEIRESIINSSKELTGNLTEKCVKLMRKYPYCEGTLANIIRQKKVEIPRDESPILEEEENEMVDVYNENETGHLYKISVLVNRFNRNRESVKSIIKRRVTDIQDKKWDCKQEYHGVY